MPAPAKRPGAALRHLRALGHDLTAIVQVGKNGVTDELVRATETALRDHELIKVKIAGEAPEDRHATAEALATATSSVLAQVIGRTALLYKRHPKEPKIKLPRGTIPQG
jgi:RNA-binding protein